MAPDISFADGYEVWVSQSAGGSSNPTPADFTGLTTNKVYSIAAEGSTAFTPRGVSLAAFAGQTVRVAFRNNSNDKFHLYIDDINVANVPSKDGAITSLTTSQNILGPSGGNVNISANLKNVGSTTIATSILKYKVDNNTAVSQSFSPGIGYFSSFTAAINNINITGIGAHKVKVWIEDINTSGIDGNQLNDTASVMVYVASQLVQRKVMYEGFSSSTCGPCATANPGLHTLLLANGANTTAGKVATVKYQMNYPGAGNDPAYTTEATTRHDLYAVPGIPNGVLNGNVWQAHPSGLTQSIIDAEYAIPTPWSFTGLAFNPAGSTVTGTLNSFVDFGNANGKFKLFCAFMEDKILSSDNTHGVQSNGETTWYEVMRKMVPSDQGTVLTAQVNNGTTPINLTYAFTGTPKVFTTTSKMTAVLWVQDMTDKHIYQAAAVGNATAITEVESKLSTLDIYPNPTNSNATVEFTMKSTETVELTVYNMMGELVEKQSLGTVQQGLHAAVIKAENLSSGLYYVNITAGGNTTTRKLAIQK